MSKKLKKTLNIILTSIVALSMVASYSFFGINPVKAFDGSPDGETPDVYGKVVGPDGLPISGVDLSLHTEDWKVDIGSSTDDDGIFRFFDVSSGTYILEIWPPSDQPYATPDPKTVTIDQTPKDLGTFKLLRAPKVLSVTVKYSGGKKDGQPVTDGQVWANQGKEGRGMSVNLNNQGKAKLYLTGGSWDVGINPKWDEQTQQNVTVDWSEPRPKKVEFKNDQSSETKSLSLRPTYASAKITGNVVKSDGKAFPGGFVEARKDGEGSGSEINPNTGKFSIPVQAGTYKLMVWPDWQNESLKRYYSEEITVSVEENKTKSVGTIVMKQKTAKIKGKVTNKATGQGVANVPIEAFSRGNDWNETQTGNDGTYTLWVRGGEYEVRIGQKSENDWVSTDFQRVTVKENQTAKGINFKVVKADAQIKIRLKNKKGQKLTNFFGYAYARIKGARPGPGSEFGSGLDNGQAQFSVIGNQTYIIGAHLPVEDTGYSLDKEKEIYIARGETKTVDLIMIENDAKITGYLKDQKGNIIKNVDAEVFVLDENWNWRGTKVAPDGSFSFSVVGGKKYMIGTEIWSEGYVRTRPEPGNEFLVSKGKTVFKIVTVFKADSVIRGKVLDPDGNPMPFAWVGANNFRSMKNKVRGDFEGGKIIDTGTEVRDGVFELSVVAGEYDVFASVPPEAEGNYMSPKEKTVKVSPNSPADVTLQFRTADFFLDAKVMLPDGSAPDFGFCHAWSEDSGFSGKDMWDGKARIPLTKGTWFIGCDTRIGSDFYQSGEEAYTVTAQGSDSKTFTLSKSSFVIPEGYSESFSASSAKKITLSDGTTISFPANFVQQTGGNLTFVANPDINLFFTEDAKPINFAWDFEILQSSGRPVESFNSAVQVCIPYDEDILLEKGWTENDINPNYWDETAGAWKDVFGKIDTVNNVACFSAFHFTKYALTSAAGVGAVVPYDIITGAGEGAGPQVNVYDKGTNKLTSFFAYDSSQRFGVKAAAGDLNGDGNKEIVTVPGKGGSAQVKVFNTNAELLASFMAFDESERYGASLAVGDTNGNGKDEIVVGAGKGASPEVRIFNDQGLMVSSFFPYDRNSTMGVNVALADTNGDGANEIVTAPAQDGSAHINVYDAKTAEKLSTFMAFDSSLKYGAYVAGGDITGDGADEIIVGPGEGGGPQVIAFDASTGQAVTNFFAFDSSYRFGLRVAAGDVDGNGTDEIVVAPGDGGGPHVMVYDSGANLMTSFFPYAKGLRYGAYVAAGAF